MHYHRPKKKKKKLNVMDRNFFLFILITINTKCAWEMVKNEYTILSHLKLICEKNFHLKKGNGLDKARLDP